MSSDVIIKVENIGKCYQIYEKPSDRLKQFIFPRIQWLLGIKPNVYFKEFWALKKVTLDIKRGEVLGVVGRNGSGKSTLLQVICGILEPSSGYLHITGRVAALLELGAGFNSEFTGRENIYLSAGLLGLSRKEIDEALEDIIKFADIGQFIDQPVKTFSSGMYVRLAFAVAINVDPEILVIDEALSVGDELFQRKCFSRIETIRSRGATILFVSHSSRAVIELCDRAVLIDAGEILAVGIPKDIIGCYQKLLYAPIVDSQRIRSQISQFIESLRFEAKLIETSKMQSHGLRDEYFDPNLIPSSTISYESLGANIDSPKVTTVDGTRINVLTKNNTYKYSYRVNFNQAAHNVRFGMVIKSHTGIEIGGSVTSIDGTNSISFVPPNTQVEIFFTFKCIVNPGVYFLNAGVFGDIGAGEIYLHRILDACTFRVADIQDCSSCMVDFGFISDVQELNGAIR